MMKVCTQCKHPGCVSMMLLSLRCPGSQWDDFPVPGSAQSDSEWELSCWASQWNPSWKQQHIPYYYFTIHIQWSISTRCTAQVSVYTAALYGFLIYTRCLTHNPHQGVGWTGACKLLVEKCVYTTNELAQCTLLGLLMRIIHIPILFKMGLIFRPCT